MKRLPFEQRKVVHYTLLSSIILLQVLAVVTWYNENKLADAFNAMSASNKVLKYTNLLNHSLIESQGCFNDYIANKNEQSLQKYADALAKAHSLADSLNSVAAGTNGFNKILEEKKQIEAELLTIKLSIDSLINRHASPDNDASRPFRFEPFGSKKMLDNIETKTYIKVKEADKKGFFSRLSDAFSGKVSVKKEYITTVVTMKYNDKVITGDVEKQIGNAFHLSDSYYESEFDRLRKSFSNLRAGDEKLMALNNKLLLLAGKLSNDYTQYPSLLADGQDTIKDQYETRKAIRSFTIVLLILLMFGISIILFKFTRLGFEYEKRLAEAQERIRKSLSFKNRITGMISHEIRSPLSILSIYSRKAGMSSKDKETKETFRAIEFTTSSLLLLSNQILEYSKDESQPMELKCRDFNLKNEMESVVGSLATLVETKGNTLGTVLDINPDWTICSDAVKIHQLFYNIVGNANKFTENGLIRVIASASEISDYEIEMKVSVTDNGAGIAESDLAHIFESHYQGIVSEKVSDLGVGLGLNICKEIVTLFDGEITIRSRQGKGKGTMVAFNLVLARA